MDKPSPSKEAHDRHCALCLKVTPSTNIKLCGGCNRRAYCSKECQDSDWSTSKNGGQGHKNWCELKCGEEDLDWEVSPVPGKGLGLIAKRNIPSKFRIIVDICRSEDHPGINDLMPADGSLQDKIKLNCLGDDNTDEDIICLRIARANHSCDANASHFYDETHNVKILFAERAIKAGKEICISYQPFNDVSKKRSSESTRDVLKTKWGIVCKSNCFCRNIEVEKMVKEGQLHDRLIMRLALKGDSAGSLRSAAKLIKIHDVIHSSWISKIRTNYDAFQVCIMKLKTVNKCDEFIRQAYEIQCAISSPNSSETLKLKKLVDNPSSHMGYRRSEGSGSLDTLDLDNCIIG